MLTDEELDGVIRTEPAAVYELRSSDATPAAVRESLRLIARMIEREAYRRAVKACADIDVATLDAHEANLACQWAIEALGREE